MSEAKHTPGPWVFIGHEAQGLGEYAQIGQIGAFSDVVARVCTKHKANHSLNKCGQANARLIAAAPELLDALAGLIGCIDHGSDDPGARLDAARAAIAKATGEQK